MRRSLQRYNETVRPTPMTDEDFTERFVAALPPDSPHLLVACSQPKPLRTADWFEQAIGALIQQRTAAVALHQPALVGAPRRRPSGRSSPPTPPSRPRLRSRRDVTRPRVAAAEVVGRTSSARSRAATCASARSAAAPRPPISSAPRPCASTATATATCASTARLRLRLKLTRRTSGPPTARFGTRQRPSTSQATTPSCRTPGRRVSARPVCRAFSRPPLPAPQRSVASRLDRPPDPGRTTGAISADSSCSRYSFCEAPPSPS